MILLEMLYRRTVKFGIRILNYREYIDAHATSVVSFGLTIFAVFAFVTMLSNFTLMNVARNNYSNNKEIEKISREIDSMKSELLQKTNIISIQRESKESGFVYNKDVKYIK